MMLSLLVESTAYVERLSSKLATRVRSIAGSTGGLGDSPDWHPGGGASEILAGGCRGTVPHQPERDQEAVP
jgi:hypothetical protein